LTNKAHTGFGLKRLLFMRTGGAHAWRMLVCSSRIGHGVARRRRNGIRRMATICKAGWRRITTGHWRGRVRSVSSRSRNASCYWCTWKRIRHCKCRCRCCRCCQTNQPTRQDKTRPTRHDMTRASSKIQQSVSQRLRYGFQQAAVGPNGRMT
jgi:hypothetical protein